MGRFEKDWNMPLTELALKNLKPKDKSYKITDGNGLHIEITPAGGKLWRWRYYFNGKPQSLALGKYPIVTLAQARKDRDDARILLEKGKHPTREKKAQKLRNSVEGENTFEKICRRWLDLKQSSLNEKYRKQCLIRMEQHVFPIIGDLPISEITIPDVVKVVEKIGKRGTVETAKRMKQLISQTFRYATQRGITVSPFSLGVVGNEDEDIGQLRSDIAFLEKLGEELTRPVLPHAAAFDYTPSQYLCEFIKKCGYDGVVYRSSVSEGINLALFKPEKAIIGTISQHTVAQVTVKVPSLED